jgi:hypothetical protein
MKADRIVLGLTLLLVGTIWVLVNIGVLPSHVAADLWRYWPLLLILWGLLILAGRGPGALGCLVPILLVIFVLSFFFAVPFSFHFGPPYTGQ